MMEIVAIIPARGGSKGIPHKNIRPLNGKPLLAYTVEQALQTPAITRVIVSTDDEEIASVARQYGAEVVWRPAEISGDMANSESALLHALDYLRETEGYEPGLVVFLQCTSPLRRDGDIDQAIRTLLDEEADSLLSVTPFHGFLWRDDGGKISSINYDYRHRPRRQDAPSDYAENGSIYVFKPNILREYNNRLGGKIALYPMSVLDSFQIDESDDIVLIEHLMAIRHSQTNIPNLSRVKLLVLDFDGVMTDNRAFVDETGKEGVLVHRSDGGGITRLKKAGVEVVVLSTEQNPVVAARCRKLRIDYAQGVEHKLSILHSLVKQHNLAPEQVAYVGNDTNDLECLCWVGLPIAVADAVPEVLSVARWVTTVRGGYGAVREVADAILKSKS